MRIALFLVDCDHVENHWTHKLLLPIGEAPKGVLELVQRSWGKIKE